MKISVIVPNYNHEPFLKQRIDSILNQSFQDFELILMDDCSTDNSKQVLEQYRNHPKVSSIIYNETNSGSTFCQWKKGIEEAKGEFIWIAESDDWCEPFMAEKLIDSFDAKTSLAFCHSKRVWNEADVCSDHHFTFHFNHHQGKAFVLNNMLQYNSIDNASMAIFRKCDVDSSVFDTITQMRYCGDWLFWIKLMEKGNVVEFTESFNYFRQHPAKVTSKARSLGLDFIEGVTVLRYVEEKFDIRIPFSILKYIAQLWTNMRVDFAPGIKNITFKELFKFKSIFGILIPISMFNKRYKTIRGNR